MRPAVEGRLRAGPARHGLRPVAAGLLPPSAGPFRPPEPRVHAAIDRGALLLWLAKKAGKTGYIEHCKAARVDDGKATSELTGPGSAWMELDVLCTNSV